jgi:expansin (peptidoglycan-binding protein)
VERERENSRGSRAIYVMPLRFPGASLSLDAELAASLSVGQVEGALEVEWRLPSFDKVMLTAR